MTTKKIRPDDRLANLCAASRAKLNAWLKSHSYRQVVALAAAPEPEGLNLKTNIRALCRYYQKFLAPTPIERLAHLSKTDPVAAQNAALAIIDGQALLMAASPSLSSHTFNSLLRWQYLKGKHALEKRHNDLKALELTLKHS